MFRLGEILDKFLVLNFCIHKLYKGRDGLTESGNGCEVQQSAVHRDGEGNTWCERA